MQLPIQVPIAPYPGDGVVGSFLEQTWDVRKLTGALPSAKSGKGELRGLSSEYVVFAQNYALFAQALTPDSKPSLLVTWNWRECTEKGVPIKPSRFYVTGCGGHKIVSQNSELLATLPSPPGWGFRHGWSEDGNRLLYDHYTRTIPLAGLVSERLLSLLTFGLGAVNETANGEVVRVVNTANGSILFELSSPGRPFGRIGDYHADISPSGKILALINGDVLSVYHLP